MARATPHLCSEPYCTNIVDGPGFCPEHKRGRAWRGAKPTPGAYGAEYRRRRTAYLREHPRCEHLGCTAPAQEIHHIDHNPLNDDWTNWRALCLEHHRRETVEQSHRARRTKSKSTSSIG